MTGYGPVSEIWFDMGSLTPEQSRGLYALVSRLQPQCMISGRLGNDCSDFSVMADNEYPDYKMGVPWQTAASFLMKPGAIVPGRSVERWRISGMRKLEVS